MLPLSHPLSNDRGQAKATHSLQCTDPSPFTISDILSREAYTDPGAEEGDRECCVHLTNEQTEAGAASGGAADPAQVLLVAEPALAQPFVGETRGLFSPSSPRAGWHCLARSPPPQRAN